MRPSSWALVGGMMLFGAAAGYYTGRFACWTWWSEYTADGLT